MPTFTQGVEQCCKGSLQSIIGTKHLNVNTLHDDLPGFADNLRGHTTTCEQLPPQNTDHRLVIGQLSLVHDEAGRKLKPEQNELSALECRLTPHSELFDQYHPPACSSHLGDLANLALVIAGDDLHRVALLHVHRDPQRLPVGCQLVVLPFLARPLRQNVQVSITRFRSAMASLKHLYSTADAQTRVQLQLQDQGGASHAPQRRVVRIGGQQWR